MKMARSRWAPVCVGLFVLICTGYLVLWATSIARGDTDWIQLAIAAVWGVLAGYYGWLIRHRHDSLHSSSGESAL
jgi:hypothetical protein